eukprot:2682513-Amphidinium_carterae.1
MSPKKSPNPVQASVEVVSLCQTSQRQEEKRVGKNDSKKQAQHEWTNQACESKFQRGPRRVKLKGAPMQFPWELPQKCSLCFPLSTLST